MTAPAIKRHTPTMGILDFIFGKQVKVENEFFGTMRFVENKKDASKSYYECNRHFIPSGKEIEIGIAGGPTGPTQEQIDFFRRIEDNYSIITNSIAPLIEDEFRNWKEGFKIADFKKEFEPVYLQIPRCETEPAVWEIAFESEHDRNHTFTLTMSGFDAKEILIDG
jgi:hypothetical protein